MLLFLKGKALNTSAKYNQEGHDLLSKAVKLDPSLNEAWIQLGESFCKNNDLAAAKNCMEGALREVTYIF